MCVNMKRQSLDWAVEWWIKALQLGSFSVLNSWYFDSTGLLVYMKFKWCKMQKQKVPLPVADFCTFTEGTFSIAVFHTHQSHVCIRPISPSIFIFNALLILFIVLMMGYDLKVYWYVNSLCLSIRNNEIVLIDWLIRRSPGLVLSLL